MELENRITLHKFYQNGITTPRKLHKQTRIPLRTIQRNLAKFRDGLGPERRSGSSAPQKLRANDKRRVIGITQKNPKKSAKKIAALAHEKGSPLVCDRTIQRYLKSVGWNKTVPLKRPYMTKKMMEKRVQWCLQNRNTDWTKVLFTDESSFQLYRITAKQWGKKRKAIPVPKHSPSLMVWGGMSYRGKTCLAIVSGMINSEKYTETLNGYLLDCMKVYYPDGWVFQQDNAPCHKSKYSTAWFAKHNITVMDWPPGSPDLNPIERLWAIIKQKLEDQNPSNLTDLKEKILKIWEEIPYETLESLIQSMPSRIEKCILTEGKTIEV